MAESFLQGPVLPSVAALPAAAANTYRLLVQGGALWFSTGSAWIDLGSLGSGGGYTITTETAGFTESSTSGEKVRLCSLAAGFTIALPTAVGNTSKLTYKKMLAAGSIIIDASGTQTIDGGLTATLTKQYEAITLVSDGANWMII